MSSLEEPTIEGSTEEVKTDQAVEEDKPQEPAQPSNDDGSTDGDDDDQGDGCWNHPKRICLCRGRRSVKRKKRSKPKQKKYQTADIPWSGLSTTYEPCVHLHFKTKTISREELTQDEYSDMLATPKGYRWVGQPTKRALRARRRMYRRKCRRMRRQNRRQKRRRGELFAIEYMADMCEMMTDEMKEKMVDLLTCEFAMKPDEADRIVKRAKACKCKKRKRRKPRISVRNVWIREFSKICADKITNYIVTMLTKKRTPRVKKIAETILKHLCDITGEQTSLHSPKTKLQHLMVLFADRIALWLDEMFKETMRKRKPTSEETSTAESSPVGTRPQTPPDKTSPKTSPDKTSPKISPDKTSPKTSLNKTSPKTSPDKTSHKTSPDKISPKTSPAKSSSKTSPDKKSSKPTLESKKSPDKSVPVTLKPTETKLDHPDDSKVETTEPKDKGEESPKEKAETLPPSEELEKTKTSETKSLSKVESMTEKEKSKLVEPEIRKTASDDFITHHEEEAPKPESPKESIGKKDSSVVIESSGKPLVIVISEEKKIKCAPGTTFAVQQGDGSHYEVSKVSELSIAEKVALVRSREVPVRRRQAPKTLSPVNSVSLKEWALWTKDVAVLAEEWNSWIETTIREVEFKNKAVKTKGGGKLHLTKAEKLEWENWKQKRGAEKMALRVENKKIQDAAKVWDKKVEAKTKSSARSSKEEVTNVTDLARTPSPASTPTSQVHTPAKSVVA